MNIIKERYVSFEVAMLLRDKGFNEPCRGVYEEKVLRINTLCDWLNSDFSEYVAAPTQAMACDWVEETFNISIELWVGIIGYGVSISYALKDPNIASNDVNQKEDMPFGDNSDGSWSDKECAYNDILKYVLTNLTNLAL